MKASGILIFTKDRRALMLKRSAEGDMPETWAFPGGKVEEGESLEQAAVRETEEETGFKVKPADLTILTRRIAPMAVRAAGTDSPPADPADPAAVPAAEDVEVDFTTYFHQVEAPFIPTLDHEHTGWAWVDPKHPPEPTHPGAQVALAYLDMDELGIAKAMAAGDLTSPQRYKNVTLFNLRITGTGVAYRQALDEYVWRSPQDYLTDEFLERCNGLTVIMEHPAAATMNSDEFGDRVIGSVMLPYIRPEPKEVWAIAKIYDDAAAQLMEERQLSTSPAVVLKSEDATRKQTLDGGQTLLIEGKPALLDHVAICERGVWDKGNEPDGVEIVQADTVSLPHINPLDHSRLDSALHNLRLLNVRLSNHAARRRAA